MIRIFSEFTATVTLLLICSIFVKDVFEQSLFLVIHKSADVLLHIEIEHRVYNEL